MSDELAAVQRQTLTAPALQVISELAEVCRSWHDVVHPGDFRDCRLYRCRQANDALRIPVEVVEDFRGR